HRVLGAYIDVGIGRTDGVAGHHHSLEYTVRVSLKNGPVHESPRVSFVGVADNIFPVRDRTVAKLPFHPRRETGAASSAKARELYLVNDFLLRHIEGFFDPVVAAHSKVVVNVLGIDEAAVAQDYPALRHKIVNVAIVQHPVVGLGVHEEEPFDRLAFLKILPNYFGDVIRTHITIESAGRHDHNRRPLLAKTMTAGELHLYRAAKISPVHLFLQIEKYQIRFLRFASGTSTNEYLTRLFGSQSNCRLHS